MAEGGNRAPLLEARNLRKEWAPAGLRGGLFGLGGTVALEDFSLVIHGSESSSDNEPTFLAIAGESGSGKTTLARLLLGLVEPTSGEVLYKGRSIRTLSSWSRARRLDFRRNVQAIFQDPISVYNPFYKVDHLLTTPVAKFGLAASRSPQEPDKQELIAGALQAVGLKPEEILCRYPHQLSAGQLQRLTIARVVLIMGCQRASFDAKPRPIHHRAPADNSRRARIEPRLIIADEPVSMVDASLRATILADLRKLHRDYKISFVYITHDLATAYQVSENIVVLFRGRAVEAGDIESVVREPKHPYTRELIGSIPSVDPTRRWARPASPGWGAAAPATGCGYLARCPDAVPRCAESAPPLFRIADGHAAACFLYDGRDSELTGGLAGVLGG